MQCPGQDSRYWSGDDVFESRCPSCGQPVEFFKDDSRQRCRSCGNQVFNPKMDFGCAAYCPHAAQCLGSLSPELLAAQREMFKDKVAAAMRQYFGKDSRRIHHAEAVAEQAEQIGRKEPGGDMSVIMACAYLHDIGIREAERKFNSSAARYQHSEGPPVARELLNSLRAKPELIDEVCDIIGHHHTPRAEETINFKVLYDADLIVNMAEEYQEKPPTQEQLNRLSALMLTETGKTQAQAALQRFIKVTTENT
ncbi:MAG: HDIG domain-containing protein [Candidatus Electronema aureum]|uniref:HDIG domain-containing protein n=1 Tax=Candidatus Electronema aureum TaxID=2005002 RepID=A0A521FZZ8_9BACT|nr:MAG: HDIG domain-containing protein [Candidatus Electronema aureum]